MEVEIQEPPKKASSFRRDVHGLRGLAILLVVGFHCRVAQLSGGFVGVEVFFVLSGHLIAHKLHRSEGALGDGWLGSFCASRLLRLCPLLSLGVAASLAAGWRLLAFGDLRTLVRSGLAAVLGGSNVYFAVTLEKGYFAADTRKVPLLHTWSLSAELQFYLAYALFHTIPQPKLRDGLLGLSFLLSTAQFLLWPEGAYFLPSARLWQFLLGAATVKLAGTLETAKECGRGARDAVAGACLVALGFAASGLGDGRTSSVLACAAAALMVLLGSVDASELPYASKLLLLPPLQVLADISYSFYVWHWPVLSFADYLAPNARPQTLLVMMIPVAGLSYLTKSLVEDRTRKVDLGFAKALLICVILPAAFVMVFLAGLERLPVVPTGPVASIFANRNSSETAFRRRTLADIRGPPRLRSQKELHSLSHDGPLRLCAENLFYQPRPISLTDGCRIGRNDSGPVEVLLTGDSHARSIAGFVDVLLRDAGLRGLSNVKTAVPFLLGDHGPAFGTNPTARRFVKARAERVSDFLRSQKQLKYVVLMSNWDAWHNGPLDAKPRVYSQLRDTLNHTLRFLKTELGLKPVLLLDYPSGQNRPRLCDLMPGSSGNCRIDRQKSQQYQAASVKVLKDLGRAYGVKVVSVYDTLCTEQHCVMSLNGFPLYSDTKEDPTHSSHLSFQTATLIGKRYLKHCQNPFS